MFDELWSFDGTLSIEDMDAFIAKAMQSLDPAELPEGAAEFLEQRRRGEGIRHGWVHIKLTPLEK